MSVERGNSASLKERNLVNYIKMLQEQVAELKGELNAAYSAAEELRSYAESDKFMGPAGYGGPTYINKMDVIHRTNVIISEMPTARFEPIK